MSRRLKILWSLAVLGVVVCVAVALQLVPWVQSSVKEIEGAVQRICAQAGARDRGSCVDALLLVLQSDQADFETKNQSIWALGQLADPRALPVLIRLRTGAPCPTPHRRDDQICQYELEKAIRWCQGEAWLMKFLRQVT